MHDRFAELVNNKLSEGVENISGGKKVFSVLVEISQNIVHHSSESVYLGEQDHKVGRGENGWKT